MSKKLLEQEEQERNAACVEETKAGKVRRKIRRGPGSSERLQLEELDAISSLQQQAVTSKWSGKEDS